ncbi:MULTISPECIES: type IV toxin-antitoxin system AbiEi family antitoxin domain-containing protein [Tsukamurella]|uniref:Type IV toxin-antitoxin system AbiEi family antitoxin domain-containing protein n=2 Tax=Tsukamurella TaxID=2060 RepID=A0A5C5RYC3_9ACTN|nr:MULTISPECIES: type IV toxin-antitoxin system AbiEi family antitoxin domain-containing protein [Tsukamurella]NMD58268.1 type IV toxin-antitoxin system AbiEi family antitoxin domain-containing protein [Tsukamurella columbiensis]TWS27021.1 type IV toxin-antitoxin system AbiEi family antitoxin domain-containing protein [Tsukamurella conjunctivitidis]
MGEIWTRRQLAAMGWSDARIRRATGTEIQRLAHGVYATGDDDAPAWAKDRDRVRAAALTCDGVVSHESAAALHGIPFFRPERRYVHFTIDRTGGGYKRRTLHVHARPLPNDHIVILDGLRVTSRCRTAVDTAMTGGLDRAVCAFDAVRLVPRFPSPDDPAPISIAELEECIAELGRSRGVAVARRALTLSVDCSESAGESLSRMQMLAGGLPMPRLQVPRLLDDELFYADFDWGTMTGEFDGRGKYGVEPEEVDAALAEEKRRHERFAAAGIEVVRWRWRVLTANGGLRRLLLPAMVRNGVVAAAA